MQEVETILRLITEDKAAVVALRDDNGNPIDMVAFCKSPALTDKEMKKACASHLPAYMIPKHIVRVDNLPLNSNGKTDYLKLVMTANGLFKGPQQDGSLSETEHAQ
jgi:acyl-CoA synthetase (AMP-forming)/AMP-acid ligase II